METRKAVRVEALKSMIDQGLTPWDKSIADILKRFSPNWSFVQKARYTRYWESVKQLRADFEYGSESPSITLPQEEEMSNIDILLVESVKDEFHSIFFDVPISAWAGRTGEIPLNWGWALELNLNFIVPEVLQRRRKGRWDDDPNSLRNRFKTLSDQSRPDEIKDSSWMLFQRWLEGISQERLGMERGVTGLSARNMIGRILLRMERRERNAKMVQIRQADH